MKEMNFTLNDDGRTMNGTIKTKEGVTIKIPKIMFDAIESSLERLNFPKKSFDICLKGTVFMNSDNEAESRYYFKILK